MFIYGLKTHNKIIYLLFDNEDAHFVTDYSFYYNEVTGYILCRSKIDKHAPLIYLQRLIGKVPVGLVGDHVNGNILDFRRDNIQAVLQRNNLQKKRKPMQYNDKPTTSEYKGVSWNSQMETWYAYIRLDGLLLNLGNYSDPHIAATVYNIFSHSLFGRFANPNIIEEPINGLSQVDLKKLYRRIFHNLLKHGILSCKICPFSSQHLITMIDSINFSHAEIPEWLDSIIVEENINFHNECCCVFGRDEPESDMDNDEDDDNDLGCVEVQI
ncbi:MAG: hypothetical protein WCK35_06445 [Chloroflexota bacterium]